MTAPLPGHAAIDGRSPAPARAGEMGGRMRGRLKADGLRQVTHKSVREATDRCARRSLSRVRIYGAQGQAPVTPLGGRGPAKMRQG